MALAIGLDIGLAAVKGAAVDEGRLVAHELREAGVRPGVVAEECYHSLLATAAADRGQVNGCVVTGWAAKRLPFTFEVVQKPEVVCLCRGAKWLHESAATVVDVGAQIVKAVRISPRGKPKRYELSDKCASGSGRFLEIMGGALGLTVSALAEVGAGAGKRVDISAQCSVFAESEIVSHVNTGEEVASIVNGVNYSIAKRVATIAMRVEVQEDVILSGGVAKNSEVRRYLEEMLGISFADYDTDPQLVCAIGAALVAGG
jgi:predicted CoA-substrate-specific enzyme activase